MIRFYSIFFIICLLFVPQKAFSLTLTLGGDAMLGRNVALANASLSPDTVWGDIKPIFQNADFALLNAELAFTSHNKQYEKKAFYFKAPSSHIRFLKALGVDGVNIANNHVLDFGLPGLKDTLKTYQKAKITYAGGGMNDTEAYKIPLIKKGSHTLALISLTDNVIQWKAGADKPGIAYAAINETGSKQTVERIEAARKNGADYVIVSIHWGGNWVKAPSPEFKNFAHQMIDAGADLIHGHSPHVFQGVEIYKNKPIFYSLGDLIDDYEILPDMRNDLGLVANVELDEHLGLNEIKIYPVQIQDNKASIARGNNFDEAFKRLNALSLPMGTSTEKSGNSINLK